jgi:hypothetical protein
MFSGVEPFRLWGVPVEVGPKAFRVRAVDLHVGETVDFEVFPEVIRVYLPSGGCGNSIIRYYTNLQHTFDAKVSAESAGERLFGFQSADGESLDRSV